MKIDKLIIDNFGTIDHYECSFNDGLSVIEDNTNGDVMLALSEKLNYPVLKGKEYSKRLRNNTCITLLADEDLLTQCKESLSCSFFLNSKKDRFEDRLNRYKKYYDSYGEKEFEKLTNGIGTSRVFSSFVSEYIKSIPAVCLPDEKKKEVVLSNDGIFGYSDMSLNDKENLFFKIYCFGCLHKFWEEALRIRFAERQSIPLVIGIVLKCLDQNNHKSKQLLKQILNTNSQIIVFK